MRFLAGSALAGDSIGLPARSSSEYNQLDGVADRHRQRLPTKNQLIRGRYTFADATLAEELREWLSFSQSESSSGPYRGPCSNRSPEGNVVSRQSTAEYRDDGSSKGGHSAQSELTTSLLRSQGGDSCAFDRRDILNEA